MSETEREDLEESEKVQHWVERLCQTRLEQISSVENESPEVKSIKFYSSILMCVGLLVQCFSDLSWGPLTIALCAKCAVVGGPQDRFEKHCSSP